MKELFLTMLKNFVGSRSCMIWLVLFITSTVVFFLGKATFVEWGAFNSGATMLALVANKVEQAVLKPNSEGK